MSDILERIIEATRARVALGKSRLDLEGVRGEAPKAPRKMASRELRKDASFLAEERERRAEPEHLAPAAVGGDEA